MVNVAAYRGCYRDATPIEGTPSTNYGAASTTATFSSITTSEDNCMIVMGAGAGDDEIFDAWYSGSGSQAFSDGERTLALEVGQGYYSQGSAGATGNQTVTIKKAELWSTIMFALKSYIPEAPDGDALMFGMCF